MTGPANRLEPPEPEKHRPGSAHDPFGDVDMRIAMEPPEAPVVGYTVKELIARMEGKLDAYAKRQDAINENVTRLVPQVDEHEKRIRALELGQLAKAAVQAWRVTYWKAGVAVLGAATSFAVIWEALHPR